MSCFVRVATQLRDAPALTEAITDCGYKLSGSKEVRGYQGTESADLVIDLGSSYDIGAIKTKQGNYEFVADWEMARVNQAAFVKKVTQAYGVARVNAAAKKAGFVIAGKKVDERGSVKMTLRRFT